MQNIHDLLDHIDEYLEENECDDTLCEIIAYLNDNNLEVESTIHWLKENGGNSGYLKKLIKANKSIQRTRKPRR